MTRNEAYTLLGLTASASQDEIKAAYRKQAMKFHPDRNKDDPAAESQFKKVKEAYEILTGKANPTQNKSSTSDFSHDKFRGSFKRGGSFYSGSNNDSNNPFRNGGFTGGKSPFENFFITAVNTDITLAQAFFGGTHKVKIPNSSDYCWIMNKPGTTNGDTSNSRVKLDSGKDAQIICKFNILPDETFILEGNNLKARVVLPLLSFYAGGTFKITTLEQKELTVKIPPNAKPGSICRLKGQGFNLPSKPRGDIIVTFDIELPQLSEEKLAQLTKLLK